MPSRPAEDVLPVSSNFELGDMQGRFNTEEINQMQLDVILCVL